MAWTTEWIRVTEIASGDVIRFPHDVETYRMGGHNNQWSRFPMSNDGWLEVVAVGDEEAHGLGFIDDETQKGIDQTLEENWVLLVFVVPKPGRQAGSTWCAAWDFDLVERQTQQVPAFKFNPTP